MWEAPLLNHAPRPLKLLLRARSGLSPNATSFLLLIGICFWAALAAGVRVE